MHGRRSDDLSILPYRRSPSHPASHGKVPTATFLEVSDFLLARGNDALSHAPRWLEATGSDIAKVVLNRSLRVNDYFTGRVQHRRLLLS